MEEALLRQVSRLNREFELIGPGDVVMVACSGGKDSWAMLHLLRAYERKVPFSFSLVAMNLDQGHPGFDAGPLQAHLEREGFAYVLERANTHDVVVAETPAGKAYCSRCSRMRRGILHRVADRIGANKIALGHHRDDAIETLMLNAMYAGRLRAMPPMLAARGEGAAVVRPVLACAEPDLAAYARALEVPILPCDLCGSQPDLRRRRVKQWLAELEREVPRLRESLWAALGNVEPDHLLDRRLSGAATGEEDEDEAATAPYRLRVLEGP